MSGSSSTDVYSGDGLRYSQTSGGVTTRYVYGADGLLLDDGTQKYVYGPSGLVFTLSETGTTLTGVYHSDGLGSVRAITDSSGSVIQTYGTDAFGNPDATQTQGSVSQPAQYTGELRDASGLIYQRARMYDPGVGRLLQRDAWGGSRWAPSTMNEFGYVDDNPITLTDRTGMCIEDLCIGEALLAVAACDALCPVVVAGAGAIAIGTTSWIMEHHAGEDAVGGLLESRKKVQPKPRATPANQPRAQAASSLATESTTGQPTGSCEPVPQPKPGRSKSLSASAKQSIVSGFMLLTSVLQGLGWVPPSAVNPNIGPDSLEDVQVEHVRDPGVNVVKRDNNDC